MAKKEMRNGELYVYCERTDEWFPKYTTTASGMRMELDEEYFIYVMEGDSFEESIGSDNNDNDPF